jgi:hypothetical protein
MKRRAIPRFRSMVLGGAVLLAGGASCFAAEPSPAATAAFNSYVGAVEGRLEQQHHSRDGFIQREARGRLLQGELLVEQITPSSGLGTPGGMIHDWRGTAFVPGATVAGFERMMKDFNSYPRYFAPQVIQAKVIGQQGDWMQAVMRVRQKHGITVVMDTTYDINFARLSAEHGYSISRSTRIAEIEEPGTAQERAMTGSEAHGFLWRLNTYWSYEEGDGGLYMQIESVSLTRAIPTGLGWIVGPFVESVPRDSLEFTLRSTCDVLRK